MESCDDETRRLRAALADCNDRLRTFGYDLFLRHKGSNWSHDYPFNGSSGMVLGPEGWIVSKRFYSSMVILSFPGSISPSDKTDYSFSVTLYWHRDEWVVSAGVGTDRYEDEGSTFVEGGTLWSWPTRRTSSLQEAISYLNEATDALIRYGESRRFDPFDDEILRNETDG